MKEEHTGQLLLQKSLWPFDKKKKKKEGKKSQSILPDHWLVFRVQTPLFEAIGLPVEFSMHIEWLLSFSRPHFTVSHYWFCVVSSSGLCLTSWCGRLHWQSWSRAASALVPGCSLPALLPRPCYHEHQAARTLAVWGRIHSADPGSHQRALQPPALSVFSVLPCTRVFSACHEVKGTPFIRGSSNQPTDPLRMRVWKGRTKAMCLVKFQSTSLPVVVLAVENREATD